MKVILVVACVIAFNLASSFARVAIADDSSWSLPSPSPTPSPTSSPSPLPSEPWFGGCKDRSITIGACEGGVICFHCIWPDPEDYPALSQILDNLCWGYGQDSFLCPDPGDCPSFCTEVMVRDSVDGGGDDGIIDGCEAALITVPDPKPCEAGCVDGGISYQTREYLDGDLGRVCEATATRSCKSPSVE